MNPREEIYLENNQTYLDDIEKGESESENLSLRQVLDNIEEAQVALGLTTGWDGREERQA